MRDVVEESSLEPLAQPSAARQRAVLLAHVEARLERRRRNRLWSLVAMALVLASVIAFVSWTSAQTPQAALAQYSAHVIDYLPPTDAAVITVRTVVGPGDVVSGSAAETRGHVRVSVQATCSGRGPGTGVGAVVEVVIALRQPLGDRTVVDAHRGRPLRQHEVGR